MATRTTVSDEEIQLRKRARRRLVGAVALVILVVAAVPMLLDQEPRQRNEQIEVKIPPIPAAPSATPAPGAASVPPAMASGPAVSESAPTPISPPPQPTPTEGAPVPQPAPTAAAPAPPPSAAPAPGASTAKASSAAADKPAPATSATASDKDGYVVQLIATTSTAKARELRQKLARQKFPAYTEKTPDGGKTRVRVGPYQTREAAESARQRLAKLDYDPGKVVRKGD